MAKTFNQFKKKIDELYWPKAGDEAKFMAMHGPYAAADVGGPETHDDAVFKGTIVQKDHTKLAPSSEELPDGQSELNDLIKNIHSRATDELLKTVSHLNLSTDPKHREHRDVINKELMYRYKNHSMSEELIGGQKNLDVHPAGRPDGRLTAKDFAILRARKNKKKMNEAMDGPHGFVPKGDREAFGTHMAKGGHQTAIQSDEPERDYSASANPRHGATKTHAAVRLNNPAAREHAKKFPGFTTSATNEETHSSARPTHDSNRIFTYYGKGGYFGGSHTHVYANPKGDKHERFQVTHQGPDKGGPHGIPAMKVSYHPDALSAQAHAEKLAGKGAERVREETELNEAFDVYVHDEKGGKEGRRVNHSKFFQTREVIDHLKNGHKVTVTHTRNDHVNKVVLHPGDHVKEKTKGIDIHPRVVYQGPDGPFSGIEEEYELDEGKFGNAMAKFTGPSKVPVLSKFIHGLQTRSAAAAAKKSKANPDNFNKLINYANARNKVREETELDEISPGLADAASRRARSKAAEIGMSGGSTTAMRAYSQQANRLSDAADKKRAAIKAASEKAAQKFDTAGLSSGKLAKLQKEEEVEEGYVSVNGQRVGPRRQPMSFAQRVAARGGERTPEQKAKTEKALKDIEDKISAKFTPDYMKKAADNAAAERKRQVDAEKAKRGISESSHKIARAIMMNEKVNLNTEEIELEDGNVIEIDIELAEAIADLFDSLDEDDQDALAEMLHSDIDSFMEVVDLLENDGE